MVMVRFVAVLAVLAVLIANASAGSSSKREILGKVDDLDGRSAAHMAALGVLAGSERGRIR